MALGRKLWGSGFYPVSYTHLDVYKRQDLNSETPMFINQIGNSYVTMLKAGYPINVFYGYVTDELFQNLSLIHISSRC